MPCFHVSPCSRRSKLGPYFAPALFLLGIRPDEFASRLSLEHADRNGKKAVSYFVAYAYMDISGSCCGNSGLWSFCFYKTENWQLYAPENEFVFFDFAEPLVFFFLDYLAVMGLFVFLGHYCSILLKWFDRKRKKA